MLIIIVRNLLNALAVILHVVINLYMWLIIARAVLSWVNPDPYNPIVRFLYNATEPVLYPIRRRLPQLGGIDFSPMALILVLIFLDNFVVRSLSEFALRLGMY